MRLSKKQMRIARVAGNPNKIDAADFRKLKRKKEMPKKRKSSVKNQATIQSLH